LADGTFRAIESFATHCRLPRGKWPSGDSLNPRFGEPGASPCSCSWIGEIPSTGAPALELS